MTRQVGPADVQPVQNETVDRIATGLITIVPVLGVAFVAWQSAKSGLHWYDLAVFAVLYLADRTRRDGRLPPPTSPTAASPRRGRSARMLAILGSMAIEGPVISWVADHRKHHAFSDREGDPHSPHVDHGDGGAARCAASRTRTSAGCSSTRQRGDRQRYAPDLLDDPMIRFIDRTFLVWAVGRPGRCRSGSASRSAAP